MWNKITERAKQVASDARRQAMARLGAGFNRADEIGGEVRDSIQEWLATSPVAAKVRARWNARAEAARAERAGEQAALSAREAELAAATAAAPPPSAAEVARASERTGFGDPAVKAQIFGRRSCPWSGRAITLFEAHKIDYDWVDLDDPEFEQLENKLIEETKHNTVPWIYLRGEFVGGFHALNEIERLGQLELRLMTPAERATANPNAAKVQIAQRENTDEVAPAEQSAQEPPS
jgi:glutaredoxin